MRVVLLSSRGARLMELPSLYPTVCVAELTEASVEAKWRYDSSSPLPVKHREFKRLDAVSYEEKE